ncbi:acyl-CoA dehydrogenase family protein [Steroidobacter sp.]|uniref:acyl-CoA dehydrogenase family protein n=1 Tax=Steroidobacter sp. TaxID=1978227 RepID=UPI001A3717C8|nr:acyl-CoA dehydrogenase [Steroidobacter sp.]MBL8271223.1 acyl-CoA dehydrogenase [Steroidobacter sp.]
MTNETTQLADRVERFVRDVVIPYERDPRSTSHGPEQDLMHELRTKARQAGVLTPHIRPDGSHLSQRDTATVLIKTGLSPLGPLACNTNAPDEGNMYLLGKVASESQRTRFLEPMVRGEVRSAFLMTEPADDQGAGSDPSMLQTTAIPDGDDWIINGRKTFITGFKGAGVGIVMANTGSDGKVAASMFLVDLPSAAIRTERVLDTIDSSFAGGHSLLSIENLRVSREQLLGEPGQGFALAQIRLSPARLSHCMRWLGACQRAHEIATAYACRRRAFGKLLIEHEGVGFQLADNLIDLKQAELMIYWCADVLDTGSLGVSESSMTKVAVADALFRVADRCVQVMGGTGVSSDTIVAQVFREIRAFRIYDGPTEVHKWSLAKKLKRDHLQAAS